MYTVGICNYFLVLLFWRQAMEKVVMGNAPKEVREKVKEASHYFKIKKERIESSSLDVE